MQLEELRDYYGSYQQMNRALGLGPGSYQAWRKAGEIPFTTQLLIQNRSKGKFKAVENKKKY